MAPPVAVLPVVVAPLSVVLVLASPGPATAVAPTLPVPVIAAFALVPCGPTLPLWLAEAPSSEGTMKL